MSVSVFEVLASGKTIDVDGVTHPTVSIDAGGHPEIADLARVHAVDGVGDIVTEAARSGDVLLLGVRMTRPVSASFVLQFDLRRDRAVLDDAAAAGSLVIAHTAPERASEDHPLWLAIDLDPAKLAHTLA